jgi:hypothetical protein
MKTSKHRLLGAVLLGASVVSFFALAFSGAWSRVLDYHTETTDSGTVTSVAVESYWPPWIRILILSMAAIGLLLLLLPKRE